MRRLAFVWFGRHMKNVRRVMVLGPMLMLGSFYGAGCGSVDVTAPTTSNVDAGDAGVTNPPTTTPPTENDGGTTCTGGKTNCGDLCFDLQGDHDNCGTCGTACDATKVCSGGAC